MKRLPNHMRVLRRLTPEDRGKLLERIDQFKYERLEFGMMIPLREGQWGPDEGRARPVCANGMCPLAIPLGIEPLDDDDDEETIATALTSRLDASADVRENEYDAIFADVEDFIRQWDSWKIRPEKLREALLFLGVK